MIVDEKYTGKRAGSIQLFRRFSDGSEEILQEKDNAIVNSGMDILAEVLAGERSVNGMYFAFDNAGSPYTDSTPSITRAASFYHGSPGGTRNFVRVPTLARPDYVATAPQYNGNRVQFTAITVGAAQLPGAGNQVSDGVSQFYGAGLVSLHPTDYQQDILFSAVTFADLGPGHFEKIAGAQIGIRWSIFFEL